METVRGSRVLITGVCGTVGSALLELLTGNEEYRPEEVICLDNRESELFFLEQEYLSFDNVSFALADMRDRGKLSRKMRGVDIVFHAAALKHVVVCERSPFEAVQTNIHGVQNLILAANENRVGRVVFMSSDKAVNPTSVMGTSKLMGERIMTAANSNSREQHAIFVSTRFGNILGSSGSVVPIFAKQIRSGGPITLTDNRMTRFVMSVDEAVRLVADSAVLAKGGEVFVTKMPVVMIRDLARVMIDELAEYYGHEPDSISIETIGMKPGEKLYEELMSAEETRRAAELDEYFVVMPAFRGIYRDIAYEYGDLYRGPVSRPYVSEEKSALDVGKVRELLKKYNVLNPNQIGDTPRERYWPGDKEDYSR